jgi:MFS family permease
VRRPSHVRPLAHQPRSPGDIATSAASFWRAIEGKRLTFALIIFLNLLVGATLKLTQFTQTLRASGEYKVSSYVSGTSFLVSFGITKAFANFFVGVFSDRWGRRSVMILGWFLGVWLSVMQLAATNWDTVAASNVWLGIQQGLTWSCCIFMLLDISGPEHRGFAIGISETAGYTAAALFSLAAAALIDEPKKSYLNPQWLTLAFMLLGLLLSFLLKETKPAAALAAAPAAPLAAPTAYIQWPSGRRDKVNHSMAVFSYASVLRGPLFAVAMAGLITNTLTGLDWGIVTQWYRRSAAAGGLALSKDQVAQATLAYEITKGAIQFLAGFASDRLGRRVQVCAGMLTQGAALLILVLAGLYARAGSQLTFDLLVWGSFTLGLGTGTLYPVLLACVSDWSEPEWRSTALGSYRFWRDLGFAIGGIIAAGIADTYGIAVSLSVFVGVCWLSAAQFWVYYSDPSDADITAAPAEEQKLTEVVPEAGPAAA